MAECKDIDRALANLARKIDAQNACCESNKREIQGLKQRVGELEKNSNGNNKQSKPTDLTAIYRRLSRIESYINALDGTGNALKQGLEQIKNLFIGD